MKYLKSVGLGLLFVWVIVTQVRVYELQQVVLAQTNFIKSQDGLNREQAEFNKEAATVIVQIVNALNGTK